MKQLYNKIHNLNKNKHYYQLIIQKVKISIKKLLVILIKPAQVKVYLRSKLNKNRIFHIEGLIKFRNQAQ